MGFINGDEGNPVLLYQFHSAIGHETFGGHIQQVQFTGSKLLVYLACFRWNECGVQAGRTDIILFQVINLVFHQGDQRRNNNGRAGAYQGGDLITHGLAATGGHQGQGIATADNLVNDFLLPADKLLKTKYTLQDRLCRLEWSAHMTRTATRAVPGRGHRCVNRDSAKNIIPLYTTTGTLASTISGIMLGPRMQQALVRAKPNTTALGIVSWLQVLPVLQYITPQ